LTDGTENRKAAKNPYQWISAAMQGKQAWCDRKPAYPGTEVET
jgi:hypothetical protein